MAIGSLGLDIKKYSFYGELIIASHTGVDLPIDEALEPVGSNWANET